MRDVILQTLDMKNNKILQTLKTIREHYDQLHANKSNDLDKMHKFLERQKLPKLTQKN